MSAVVGGDVGELLRLADVLNSELESCRGRVERSGRGQFTTPSEAAWAMASLVEPAGGALRVVDAGAGAGALMLALVAVAVERGGLEWLSVDLVETDRRALNLLETAARAAHSTAEAHGLRLETRIADSDFCDLVSWDGGGRFDVAILNPPYMKLKASDPCRRMVRRRHGVDCPNLYAAFLTVAVASLDDGGQLVAITPRSFANGLYFTGFRRHLTDVASFSRVVLFDRRDRVFRSSSVLQETVIFSMRKTAAPSHGALSDDILPDDASSSSVLSDSISLEDTLSDNMLLDGESSDGVLLNGVSSDGLVRVETRCDHLSEPHETHDVPHDRIVQPHDAHRFINLPGNPEAVQAAEQLAALPDDLGSMGLTVSTGPVVDFRCREFLTSAHAAGTVPLIYPVNVKPVGVKWPQQTNKPQGFTVGPHTRRLLYPNGFYVLVKRFTAKEEKRRVIAGVYEPVCGHDFVAFENHVNVIHRDRMPLLESEAVRLADFLNSNVVDTYFRMFSGNTQVNATDLRRLRFPASCAPQRLSLF